MFESLWESLIKTTLGMLLILGGWLVVQVVCKRASGVPTGDDALAGRLGCHGCGCERTCERTRERENK
jgi:hypothetical protein